MDSYNTILTAMKDKYTELSGSEVPEGSDIDIRMKILAGEIFDSEMNLDFIKRQMFASTATGSYLDLHAQDRGLNRNKAVKATGEVTFSINTVRDDNVVIPQGTIVGTSGGSCVRFSTDRAATISAGTMSATVPCTAETAGFEGNVLAQAIDIIITNVTGVDSVTNNRKMTGGSDAESDESLRNRVLKTYISVSNGTNAAFYKKLAQSVDGVKSANVVSGVRGAGTVDVYLGGYNENVTASMVTEAQRIINEQRELNVNVRVSAASVVNVNLGVVIMIEDGFDFNAVCAALRSAINSYISSLEVGADVLESQVGKIVISVDGVYDYYWMSNFSSSYPINSDEFAKLSTVVIEEDTW